MSFVFVFGSNLAGRHGKGAAKFAVDHFGAHYGVPEGRQGMSYAIPTKDADLNPLPLSEINLGLQRFALYASQHPRELFVLTPIGSGLTGHSRSQITLLLRAIALPENVVLHRAWIGGVNDSTERK